MKPYHPGQAELLKHLSTFLPHDKQKGKPFYIFMEVDEHRNTSGSFHTLRQGDKNILVLFPSFETASRMEPFLRKHSPQFRIRGVAKKHLEALIRLAAMSDDLEIGIITSIDSVTGDLGVRRFSGKEILREADKIEKEGLTFIEGGKTDIGKISVKNNARESSESNDLN